MGINNRGCVGIHIRGCAGINIRGCVGKNIRGIRKCDTGNQKYVNAENKKKIRGIKNCSLPGFDCSFVYFGAVGTAKIV